MKKALIAALIIMISASILYAKKTDQEYIADLDSSKQEQVVIEAAKWAADKKNKQAVPNLIKLLSDQRDNVRMNAAVALGYIGEESAAISLNKVILQDKSSNVRYAALLSSVRIGSKESVETWVKAKETETDATILDFLNKMEEKAKKSK